MSAEKKLPDATVVRRLRNEGLMLKDIGKLYGVSESAVWKVLNREGYVAPQHTYHEIVPWTISQEHKAVQVMIFIRRMVKLKNGDTLSETEQKRLDKWLNAMREDGVVLAYHPDAPPNMASQKGGFYYVPREPWDEDRFYRDPEIEEQMALPQKVTA